MYSVIYSSYTFMVQVRTRFTGWIHILNNITLYFYTAILFLCRRYQLSIIDTFIQVLTSYNLT